jgi:hypothetical protein
MTCLCADWREFVIIPRGLGIAIVFDFTRPAFYRIRNFAEQAQDGIRFLARVCLEPRITKTSLARCLADANDAHRARWAALGEVVNRLRVS